MFSKIMSILFAGVKLGFVVMILAGILAFLGAPTFFGIVIITAGVMMTVYTYATIAFVIGVVYKTLMLRKEKHELNEA
jgi:uncharacterized protein (UPF0333 family)